MTADLGSIHEKKLITSIHNSPEGMNQFTIQMMRHFKTDFKHCVPVWCVVSPVTTEFSDKMNAVHYLDSSRSKLKRTQITAQVGPSNSPRSASFCPLKT